MKFCTDIENGCFPFLGHAEHRDMLTLGLKVGKYAVWAFVGQVLTSGHGRE